MQVKIRKQSRHPLSEHGLPDARRAVEEHVMPAGCGYLTSPLSLHLTGYVC